MQEISASAAPGVIVRGHGAGLGVAVAAGGDAIDHAALAVARDVIPFDQRGCLTPRAVLVEGDALRAEAFARALHAALGALSIAVPRGPLDAGDSGRDQARIARRCRPSATSGRERITSSASTSSPRALLVLPPAARVVHGVPALAGAALLDVPWAGYSHHRGRRRRARGLAGAVRALAPRARRARLGEMQRPPLDGPVDRRAR